MRILGLHWENSRITFAVIKRKTKKILLYVVGECPSKNGFSLIRTHKTKLSCTSLACSEVFIKQAKLPGIKIAQIKKAIPIYAETLSSISPDECFYVAKPKMLKPDTLVRYHLTKKSLLQKHISKWDTLAIDPDHVTTTAQALIRFCKSLFSEMSDALILHVGRDETTLVWMKDHFLEYSLSMDFNAEDIQKKTGEKLAKHPINEIFSAISSIQLHKPLPLMITGHTNQSFAHALEDSLKKYVSHIIPHKGKLESWAKFAIAIGNALDAVSRDSHSIQFRTGPFTPQKKLKKWGKSIVSFYLMAIIAVAGIFKIHFSWLDFRQKSLHTHLLQSMIADRKLMQESFPPKNLHTFSEISHWWRGQMQKENRPNPYFIKTPKIKTFLLSFTQKNLFKKQKGTLLDFHYELTSEENGESPASDLNAEIRCEIAIASSQDAREFFEGLKDDSMIDNESITWEISGDQLYSLQFSLRSL
jgi:hypothetical protein